APEAPVVESVKLALVIVKEDDAPEAKLRAAAKLLPIPTALVELPVLILVALFEEALILTAPPARVTVPATFNRALGTVEPIPTLPLFLITNLGVPFWLAVKRSQAPFWLTVRA